MYCHLNKNISCNFSKLCVQKKKNFKINRKYFNVFSFKYHLENKELLSYLINKGVKKAVYCGNLTFKEVLILKYKKLKEFSLRYSKVIYLDKSFGLFIGNNKDNLNFEGIYPKCCTNFYFKFGGDEFLGNNFFIKKSLENSNFFCPLLCVQYSFLNDRFVNNLFSPFYRFCSFDCKETIEYAQAVFNKALLDGKIQINKMFSFLKNPLYLGQKYIIIFNGYYNDGIIYYNSIFLRDYDVSKNIVFLKKINTTYVKSNNVIIPGEKKYFLPSNIKLIKL